MSLSSKTISDRLQSHLLASGLFEKVNGAEPKSPPAGSLTAAVWVDRIAPVPTDSPLNATTALLVAMIRLYSPMLQEPQDAIDPALVAATDTIIGDLSADYTLDGTIRNVDLLGQSGTSLGAQAGYVSIQQTMYRVIDITVPCLVSDAWSQTA